MSISSLADVMSKMKKGAETMKRGFDRFGTDAAEKKDQMKRISREMTSSTVLTSDFIQVSLANGYFKNQKDDEKLKNIDTANDRQSLAQITRFALDVLGTVKQSKLTSNKQLIASFFYKCSSCQFKRSEFIGRVKDQKVFPPSDAQADAPSFLDHPFFDEEATDQPEMVSYENVKALWYQYITWSSKVTQVHTIFRTLQELRFAASKDTFKFIKKDDMKARYIADMLVFIPDLIAEIESAKIYKKGQHKFWSSKSITNATENKLAADGEDQAVDNGDGAKDHVTGSGLGYAGSDWEIIATNHYKAQMDYKNSVLAAKTAKTEVLVSPPPPPAEISWPDVVKRLFEFAPHINDIDENHTESSTVRQVPDTNVLLTYESPVAEENVSSSNDDSPSPAKQDDSASTAIIATTAIMKQLLLSEPMPKESIPPSTTATTGTASTTTTTDTSSTIVSPSSYSSSSSSSSSSSKTAVAKSNKVMTPVNVALNVAMYTGDAQCAKALLFVSGLTGSDLKDNIPTCSIRMGSDKAPIVVDGLLCKFIGMAPPAATDTMASHAVFSCDLGKSLEKLGETDDASFQFYVKSSRNRRVNVYKSDPMVGSYLTEESSVLNNQSLKNVLPTLAIPPPSSSSSTLRVTPSQTTIVDDKSISLPDIPTLSQVQQTTTMDSLQQYTQKQALLMVSSIKPHVGKVSRRRSSARFV